MTGGEREEEEEEERKGIICFVLFKLYRDCQR
jgi:hypothetical protein